MTDNERFNDETENIEDSDQEFLNSEDELYGAAEPFEDDDDEPYHEEPVDEEFEEEEEGEEKKYVKPSQRIFDTARKVERVILVGVTRPPSQMRYETDERLDELELLTETAGAEVLEKIF